MSTAINIFLRLVIKTNRLPFEVKNKKLSKELIEAIKEGNIILKELEVGKKRL